MIRTVPWLMLVGLLIASPAFAHAFLERADPLVGGSVSNARHTLRLRFTEGVEPRFSTVELRDAQGSAVAIGKPHIASGSDRELLVTLPDLHSGRYTVTWHITSVDTRKTEGSFQFSVAQ